MKLSTLEHDYIIYKELNDNDIYCSKITYRNKNNAIDVIDYAALQGGRLTDNYGWLVLHQADSFEELQALYPEFFI